jgi:ketosteroid isomerase-like protein
MPIVPLTGLAALTWFLAPQTSHVYPPVRAKDAEEIRLHIDSIFKAYMAKDREMVRKTHSDDWRGFTIGSRNIRRGIDEYMQLAEGSLSNRTSWMTAYKMVDYDTIFHGDIALVCYVAEIEGRSGDKVNTDKYRVLDVYQKRGGGWIQVGTNTARHPDAVAQQFSKSVAPNDQLRAALLQSREQVWRAWFDNDQDKLKAFITEDAIAIDADEGPWGNRDTILSSAEAFKKSGGKLVSLEFPRTEIQLIGYTAILYTSYSYETEVNGKRTKSEGRGTEVFVIRDGKLVNTGWHLDKGP